MKLNKTVGGINIKLDTKRLDTNMREAQKKLNMQIAADCKPIVPFQQGELRGSIYYPEGIYGGEIAWDTPYAHYQYEGKLYLTKDGRTFANMYERKYPTDKQLIYHEAATGCHWFEIAKNMHEKQWMDLVKRTAGKG